MSNPESISLSGSGGASAPPPEPRPPESHPCDLLSRTLVWLEEAMLVVLFLSLLGLGLSQIVMRNLFDSAPAEIETVLRALVLWIALLGAAVAARRRRHIVVDLLGHYLNRRARRFVGVIANLFTAYICALLTWAGLQMVQLELSFDPVALFGPLPRWWVQLPMPLAFAVMTSQFLLHALEDLIGFIRPPRASSNSSEQAR